jgi:hypothetical protein
MAITRKPKAATAHVGAVSEQQISQLISKGGSIAKEENKEDKQVLVRIPKDLLEKVDALAQSRRIRTPRNTWIVEALFEKVERESA